MNINSSKTIDISTGDITEPVTVQELKDYLRLEGFIDDGESTSDSLSDFDYDDGLIADIITSARGIIEKRCGISCVPKTLKSLITNMCGNIEIPEGPVSSITSLTDSSGDAIAPGDYQIRGFFGDFPELEYPCQSNMVMIYEAGYGAAECPALPKGLKMDIRRLAGYMYLNRGDDAKIEAFSYQLAGKYSRKTWLE